MEKVLMEKLSSLLAPSVLEIVNESPQHGLPKEAEKHLRFVLNQEKVDEGLKSLATIRLAMVLSEKGDNKGALALLAADTNPAFTPSREELRGDLLKSTGDIEGAQKAYQAAMAALMERKEPRPLLEMKMADVGLEMTEIKRPSPVKEPS